MYMYIHVYTVRLAIPGEVHVHVHVHTCILYIWCVFAEVPDDEQLNDMIAHNEDEMELFTVSATRHSVHVQCTLFMYLQCTRACTK